MIWGWVLRFAPVLASPLGWIRRLWLPVALLVAMMAGVWLAYKVAYSNEARRLEAIIAAQGAELRNYEARLREREKARRAAQLAAQAWEQRWRDDQQKPEVRDWVAVPIPDAVRQRVRELTDRR